MFHIAQINIARAKAPVTDPMMAAFVARLEEINALADAAPGFVWRLKDDAGDATYIHAFDDERILINMSVWTSVEALRDYVYKSAHSELLRDRRQWFEHFEGAQVAMWWVPAGEIPSIDDAKKRLAHLETHGPTDYAFTFKTVSAPPREMSTATT